MILKWVKNLLFLVRLVYTCVTRLHVDRLYIIRTTISLVLRLLNYEANKLYHVKPDIEHLLTQSCSVKAQCSSRF